MHCTYATDPLPHPRYSPVSSYLLLFAKEIIEINARIRSGEYPRNIMEIMVEARLARERVISNPTLPYIIPNSVSFGDPFFQRLHHVLHEFYDISFLPHGTDDIDIVHEAHAMFLRKKMAQPRMQEIPQRDVFLVLETVLEDAGAKIRRKKT
jgi:hypothetical protein